MQSTNEELEASKEELQSVNEELQTLNLELSAKVEALGRAHDDLQNLFDSTDVATVFLDRDLLIRSFTPAATRIFNLLPGDRGRPITDLSSRFAMPDLGQDIAAVLMAGEAVERRLDQDKLLAHYLVRLAPYRNSDRRVEGVVVSFVDITGVTQAERHGQILIAELHHRTRNLLGVVQAIVTQTLGRDTTPKALTQRLVALGRVQDLLGKAPDEGTEVAEILRLELQAYAGTTDGRVTLAGPPVTLPPERVQLLALALHELTTNAVKYGALNGGAGRLEVGWSVESPAGAGPVLVLEWRESGVVLSADTSRRGYGRELIERALPRMTRSSTEFSMGPDGVRCRIEVPLSARPVTAAVRA